MDTINYEGFITHWLVSGLKTEVFEAEQVEKHQVKFEHYMRKVGIRSPLKECPTNISLGEDGIDGCPWSYYYFPNNWFVDLSSGYTNPTYVEGYAYTQIHVVKHMLIRANIWSYAAVEVWLNGSMIYSLEQGYYKPVQKAEVLLVLEPGQNTLFLRMQNVGVRDTRNIVGVQLLENLSDITVSLPSSDSLEAIRNAEDWLWSISYIEGTLQFSPFPSYEVCMEYDGSGDVIRVESNGMVISENVKVIRIWVEVQGKTLERLIELGGNYKPLYDRKNSLEEARNHFFHKLSTIPYQQRGNNVKASAFYVLARYATKKNTQQDIDFILRDLTYVDRRMDCSDFWVSAIVRLMKNYELEVELKEAIKKSFLNYRYWMDEEGSDGMCFWSENHSLMFHSSQMLLGEMYPDDIFLRSRRTGKEQYVVGRRRCVEWLEEVEDFGFEEFISATYTSVSVVALLNLVDFGDEELSSRATKLLDGLFEILVKHIYDGVIIGPQGRVYRDVIYPFKQSAQELIHYINDKTPTVVDLPNTECMWLSCLATSKYRIDPSLPAKMEEEVEETYCTAEAEIHLWKKKDYVLTSVSSPRENYYTKIQEGEPFGMQWLKHMNVDYHGTTCFEPKEYGYQQHLWYAALANDCAVFVNHPGATTDRAQMRPGYWYGNGVFPAVRQDGNTIYVSYDIPENHPISFTHLYWPTHNFDEILRKEHWIFGRKNKGYIGIWCSGELYPFNDILQDREYRVNGREVEYVCQCGSEEEFQDFSNFITYCQKKVKFKDK